MNHPGRLVFVIIVCLGGVVIGGRCLIRGNFVTTNKIRLRTAQAPVSPAPLGWFAKSSVQET
jgi:hypothetical protein